MADVAKLEGLGPKPRTEWPEVFGDGTAEVINLLEPNSTRHAEVRDYFIKRLEDSERAMSKFYARWQVSEKKVQAYIDLPDWEKQLDAMNKTGAPPSIVSITVPYSFATISTIVTFMVMAFTSKKPMFQVGARKAESVEPAKHMEMIHDYNAGHTRLIKHLIQFFRDAETYGVGILRLAWKKDEALRTVIKKVLGPDGREINQRGRELTTVFEGNEVRSWDPFMFFPDPSVPMSEVNLRGEYVFWRSFEGLHALLKMQDQDKTVKWVNFAGQTLPISKSEGSESQRSLRADGESNPSSMARNQGQTSKNYLQVDQGTCEIIPRELGLGKGELPQKWLVTILNKQQIVQLRPVEDDHGRHPVAVAEPYTLGYGFGHLGMADYLGPLQDSISWFLNSHFDNVRRALNDMFVVDPSLVEMQDLKRPGPGKVIRLKRAAFGKDVRSAIHQLDVHDVTTGHVKDAELMMLIGQRLSSVTDSLTGVQQPGGRQTATEVRTKTGGALSRLQGQAKLYSAQAITDLTEMQTLNVMQYISDEFYAEVTGTNGQPEGVSISPDMLVGDFHYPIHDGTMPMDKIALLDIWRQIFGLMQTDPVLRQTYSVPKTFEFMAELGGIVNLPSFRITTKPDAQVEEEFQRGQLLAGALGSNGGGNGQALSQLLGGSGAGQPGGGA